MAGFEFGSAWSLTERPRQVEVAMALIFAINLITTAVTEIEISWLWFAVGILAWAATVGPIGASRLGRSVSEWLGRIGVAGHLLGIAVVIGVFWIAVPVLDFSPVPFYSFGFGGMFVITVLILARYAGSVVQQAGD